MLRSLRDAHHGEALDRKWAEGMDKEDVRIDPTLDGWHLHGFLSIGVGAKLKAVLESVSVPRTADDTRSASERRIDGLDALLSGVLESGLPADRGVRPQLGIMVDFDTAVAQLTRHHDLRTTYEPGAALEPAELIGFGAIGRNLLAYLACHADQTDYLVRGETAGEVPQANILNVGRTRRLATVKQRQAVLARQGGVCAAPGCHLTHLELHHVVWYSEGGPTDLDLLVGLCRRCHLLVHAKKLFVVADGCGGFTFDRVGRQGWRREAQQVLATSSRLVRASARRGRLRQASLRHERPPVRWQSPPPVPVMRR